MARGRRRAAHYAGAPRGGAFRAGAAGRAGRSGRRGPARGGPLPGKGILNAAWLEPFGKTRRRAAHGSLEGGSRLRAGQAAGASPAACFRASRKGRYRQPLEGSGKPRPAPFRQAAAAVLGSRRRGCNRPAFGRHFSMTADGLADRRLIRKPAVSRSVGRSVSQSVGRSVGQAGSAATAFRFGGMNGSSCRDNACGRAVHFRPLPRALAALRFAGLGRRRGASRGRLPRREERPAGGFPDGRNCAP
jgi:hypothetical protein